MSVTVNQDQRLFVIPCGEGFSCLGFDVCYNRLLQLATKLYEKFRISVLDEKILDTEIGTLKQYEQYQKAVRNIGARNLGTFFNNNTPKKVQRLLEDYRRSESKIRIVLGDPETGRDWMEENDVLGRVGRSTGSMKVPLLIADGECGGGAILDGNIVRMFDVASGKELYRHPKYQVPNLAIAAATEEELLTHPAYSHAVSRDGECVARFHSIGKAAQYVAFICGESMTPPNSSFGRNLRYH